MWFTALQGLLLTALGVWAVAQGSGPAQGGLGLIAFGVAWMGLAVLLMRHRHKSDKLREALAAADSAAGRQNRRQKLLLWVQWGLFAAATICAAMTVRMPDSGGLWPLYGGGALLLAMLGVMLYRTFITANLDAEAMSTLSASIGGAQKRQLLGQRGSGVVTVLLVVIIFAGVIVDEYANLPLKVMSLFWYALGLLLVGAVAVALWRWLRGMTQVTERQE